MFSQYMSSLLSELLSEYVAVPPEFRLSFWTGVIHFNKIYLNPVGIQVALSVAAHSFPRWPRMPIVGSLWYSRLTQTLLHSLTHSHAHTLSLLSLSLSLSLSLLRLT
jgi:hypothetical protein